MSDNKLDLQEVTNQLLAGSNMAPELAEIFSEEAEEHMLTIYDGMDRMRADNTDTTALGDVRRAAHTLKGAAGAVGMEAVTRISHRMEDLLDHLAETNQHANEEQIHLLLATADQLQDLTTTEVDIDATAKILMDLYQQYDAEMVGAGAGSTDDQTAEESQTNESAAVEEEFDAELAAALAGLGAMGDLESEEELSDEQLAAAVAGEAETAAAPEAEPQPVAAAAAASTSSNEKSNQTAAPAKEATQFLRVPLDRIDSLVGLVGEMIVNRSSFAQRLTDMEQRIEDMQTALSRFRTVAHDVETRYSVEALRSGTRSSGGALSKTPLAGGKSDSLDSLEFDRYTEFHLLARTLSESTNDVAVITSEFRTLHGDFDSLLGRQQRLTRDAQDNLMHIRMVPVSNIVNRLDRTVRSVSNKLGKKVDLVIKGEGTELDKTVLEEITDPLLHLIRNALDHGVESPEARKAAGKPEKATLQIEALNQGTQVTIRVSDDGGGLDLAKIRKLAVNRGMIKEDQELTQEEMRSLIFLPGFSTADKLTDVSGRGVGMDVVREAVQRLKGSISVDSEQGQGSTFTVHLPTTLAVSRALLIESNGLTFAIPMQAIQQILRLDPANVSVVGSQPIINLGDRTVRLKEMASHLQLRSEDKNAFAATKPLLLIRTGDDEMAITVDDVIGGQDIVVKTLGDHLASVPGLIGATVAGDGTVIPILDPSDLVGQEIAQRATTSFANSSEVATVDRRRTAMVIDDSISVRRVTTNLLRSSGWDVLSGKDGVDALEVLETAETPPEVFLCDMEMPRMDGIELIGRLRNQEEFRNTPIVMVTSRAGEKHRKMASDAGANEHVVKPFNDDQLITLITRLVNEAREAVQA
jgi:chemosensory pili system protein ChpA (sensor histidine kinase/response regulator)